MGSMSVVLLNALRTVWWKNGSSKEMPERSVHAMVLRPKLSDAWVGYQIGDALLIQYLPLREPQLLPELFLHKRQVTALALGQAAGGLLGQPLCECNFDSGVLVRHQTRQGFEPGGGELGNEFFLQ